MNSLEVQCAEGVILHMIPYRNYDQILTVFTSQQGVLKFFCKKGKGQRYMPLTRAEFAYREKKSELFACEEISIVDSYVQLRNQFVHLQAGCDLIRTVSASQVVGKAAPLVYQLLIFYLDKIPNVADAWTLALSFRLKILKHEGMLNIESNQLDDFSTAEMELLIILTYSQSYLQLAPLVMTEEFKVKVIKLFLDCMHF
jgi:DNA repair protein RecO (recombination protein O)